MTAELTIGSICTGYDGLGMAVEMATGAKLRHLWMAENEASVAKVLTREHPGVPNVGDIKVAPWNLAPHVQIMTSGDPCQTISIAGRQQGRKDERFLWPWVRAAYRAVRPDAIFFENVANIVSHDGGRTLAERFEHLRADGYAVRWTVVGACAVGAPHHRHRWYALAARVPDGVDPGPAVRVGGSKAICGAPRSGGRFLLPSPMARDGDGRGEGDPEYWQRRLIERGRTNGMPLGAAVHLLPSPTASDVFGPGRTERKLGGDDLRTAVSLLPTPMVGDATGGHSEPQAGGVRPSGAKRMDSLGSVVPLLPTPMADRSGSNRGGAGGRGEDQPPRPSLDSVAALLPTPRASDGPNGGPNQRSSRGEYDALPGAVANLLPTPTAGDSDRGTNSMGSTGSPMLGAATRPEIWGKYAEAIAIWEAVTGVPAPAPTERGAKGGMRLAPALPEWMMGLRPGLLTDELTRSEALKAAGNGVVALAAAAAWRILTAPLPA